MPGQQPDNKTTIQPGQGCHRQVGGDSPMTITSGSNKLTNVVDGLTINLTKAQAAGDAPVTLTVGQDHQRRSRALQKSSMVTTPGGRF
jgi:flagellar hook-associated protein 2